MIDVSSLSPDLMADLTRLPRYVRLGVFVVVTRDRISAIPGGGLIAAIDMPDGPSTVTFHAQDLREAALNGFLAASDDPLYLISEGDQVELSDGEIILYRHSGPGDPLGRNYHADPLTDPHAEAAKAIRALCPKGVRPVAVRTLRKPSEDWILIRENTFSPELPWICPLCPPAKPADPQPMVLSSLRTAADPTIQWKPWSADLDPIAAHVLPWPDDDRR